MYDLSVCKILSNEGERVDLRGQAKEVIINKGGIAKFADFVAAEIRAVDVVNLCNVGFLYRVRHGYYELAKKARFLRNNFLQHSFQKESFALNLLFFIIAIAILSLANGL